MWAVRRSANSLRCRDYIVRASLAFDAQPCIAYDKLEVMEGFSKPTEIRYGICFPIKRSYQTQSFNAKFSMGSHSLSSQAGTKSNGEENDTEDGFSELDISGSTEENTCREGNAEELVSEPEHLDDDLADGAADELELLDTDTAVSDQKGSWKKRAPSGLFSTIVATPVHSINHILDKWVDEGKDLSRDEIWRAMQNLRKRRLYTRALQLSEWLEAKKHLEFVERDYASRIDLIAKVHGLQKAEKHIEKIPESFRGEVVYRTLLANCVFAVDMKKAEEVFNKMRDLEFPMTAFTCNQLLLLYKRLDKKRIADVLLMMEKENVKPSLFTYNLLIDTKGQYNDITGMETVYETMKAEGIEPILYTQYLMAKYYISGGLKEKAEAVLKEMEGGDEKENRLAFSRLLPLYAALGKDDEVRRLWNLCEPNPRIEECMAAIDAWGKLHKVEEAEKIFEKMSVTWKLTSRNYCSLLRVYGSNKLLSKGKDLMKRMADSGCFIGPLTWDALVKLYVEAGEVEKADSVLWKAAQQNWMKPLFSSYVVIMDQYAKRGDIHNAEKMFHRMRQSGYIARQRQYLALVEAYINAKAPAYGLRERMKADNLFPNKSLAALLVQVDAFRKTAVSDILD